jgi:MoxR-like ATPase
VRLVLATREPAQHGLPELEGIIAHGASPRATLGLLAGSRALALMRGRSYAVPRDVFDVARDVLRHRVLLSFDAIADDVDPEAVVERITSTVLAPRVTPSQDAPSLDDQSTWAA